MNKIAADPDIVQYDSEIVADAKANPKYGKEAFSFTRSKNVQLGGIEHMVICGNN